MLIVLSVTLCREPLAFDVVRLVRPSRPNPSRLLGVGRMSFSGFVLNEMEKMGCYLDHLLTSSGLNEP